MNARKKMNKILSTILITFILALCMLTTAFADGFEASISDIKIYLNGLLRDEDVMIINGSSYLPVRNICNLLGVNVDWNQNTRTINLSQSSSISYKNYGHTLTTGSYVGTVKLTFDNGTVYSGGYKDGKFHGKGKIIYANGTIYEGDFVEGKLHGKGKYIALNGDIYTGYFKNDDYYGYGTYTYSNGDKISGNFDSNKITDVIHVQYKAENITKNLNKWTETIQKVDIYDVSFNPLLYNGTADIVYSNGISYVGSVSYNKYNGKGKISYQDGSVYDGYWVKDHKNGKGVYKYANGEVYDGYLLDDKYEGLGKYTFINGDCYNGQWSNNKKEGKGTYTYANGNKFEGAWKNDVIHTIGYEGGYSNYKKDYGKYTINKKNIYVKNAEYRDIRDKIYYQKWRDGKIISERSGN